MSDNHPSYVAGLLTPATSAIAGFAVAVIALLGQNAVTAAVGNLLGPAGFGDPIAFSVVWGVAVLLQAALAVWLARRALASAVGWVDALARAAVVVAAVAAVAGVLFLLGGVIHEAT